MNTYFGYSETELTSMTIAELKTITDASWALNRAMHNSADFSAGSIAMRHTFSNWWWEISEKYISKLCAIERLWASLAIIAREQAKDQEFDIARLWESMARLASLSTPQSCELGEMESYVIEAIWDKSDNRRIDEQTFENAYWCARSNTAKVKLCVKWARASWTFGVPDFR